MVRISTREVLWTRTFDPGNAPIALVVSHDVRYIAENSVTLSGGETTVLYSGGGSRMTQYNASVAAFSWDGSTMVLFSDKAPRPAWVASLDGNRVLWAAPTANGAYVWSAKAQPRGGGLAIVLASRLTPASARSSGYPPVDLHVVDADGTAVTVLRGIYW